MIGGTRNAADESRVRRLTTAIAASHLSDAVAIRTNVPRDAIARMMRRCGAFLHTMREEHFGIGVVEACAAGLVVIAHASGGVAADIIRDGVNGLLVHDVERRQRGTTAAGEEVEEEIAARFAERMADVAFRLPAWRVAEMQRRARENAARFSDTAFARAFHDAVRPLLDANAAASDD